MRSSHHSEMRLYNARVQRLYVNANERARFLNAARTARPHACSLCFTLAFTGCRISEALNLTPQSIQVQARLITFRTLKRRGIQTMREVPVPGVLLTMLAETHDLAHAPPDQPLWQHNGQRLNRATAYRWVKAVMLQAEIRGAQACPKGLRHGFGVQAIRSGVQLNMLQKWMGHASLDTTAIYANAIGEEELAIAERMWR